MSVRDRARMLRLINKLKLGGYLPPSAPTPATLAGPTDCS